MSQLDSGYTIWVRWVSQINRKNLPQANVKCSCSEAVVEMATILKLWKIVKQDVSLMVGLFHCDSITHNTSHYSICKKIFENGISAEIYYLFASVRLLAYLLPILSQFILPLFSLYSAQYWFKRIRKWLKKWFHQIVDYLLAPLQKYASLTLLENRFSVFSVGKNNLFL